MSPWNFSHSTLKKYLVCQAWMLTCCCIFREYLGAIWVPEFELEQRQSCSNTHICCAGFVTWCSQYSCPGCFRHLFGQQKKEELLGLPHKSQWITASRQSKTAVRSSSGGLKCIHQTFTFIPARNKISVCQSCTIPGVTFPCWSIINLTHHDIFNSLLQGFRLM